VINQLNYQFLIFSFLSFFNIIWINYVNSDYALLYQELKLKNYDIIISEFYFNETKYKLYLLHLFNIIMDDSYCKLINQKITFLHLSEDKNFNSVFTKSTDFFKIISAKYKYN
jgi:hypothetical protein